MVSKSFRLQKLQQLKLREPRGDLGKAHKKNLKKVHKTNRDHEPNMGILS